MGLDGAVNLFAQHSAPRVGAQDVADMTRVGSTTRAWIACEWSNPNHLLTCGRKRATNSAVSSFALPLRN